MKLVACVLLLFGIFSGSRRPGVADIPGAAVCLCCGRIWRGGSRPVPADPCIPGHAEGASMNLELSLFSIMLVPFAAAGLALIHQGLGRSRSAAHAMLASLCALAVSAIVFVLFGAAWAGSAGAATHSFTLGGAHWDWLGRAPFFARGISFDGSDAAGLDRSLVLCLELFAAGLAGDHSAERGDGPLAARADLSHQRAAGRSSSFPSSRTGRGAGDGWRGWQRTSDRQLHRRRRRGHGAGGGRAGGALGGVDRRAAARQVLRRRHGGCDSRTQHRAGALRLPAGAGGLDRARCGCLDLVLRRGAAAGGRRGDQRDARGLGRMPRGGCGHALALPQAGRVVERQWMDRRAGGGQRIVRDDLSGGGDRDRADRGRAGDHS